MSYSFDTIDGLFRPNYKVYNYETKDSKTKSEDGISIVEPVMATYKPQDLRRVKSVITEVPSEEVGEAEPVRYEVTTELEGLYPQQDYKRFKQEMDIFLAENPEYESIKDSLYRLAALESSYQLGVTNKAGSGALGWFQFMDGTRKAYNTQTREQFAKDPQAQLLAAAQHYTKLQHEIAKRGGDPTDFETMYGAWWRPESAYAYLKDPSYDFKTKFGESFQQIRRRARNLVNKDGESHS